MRCGIAVRRRVRSLWSSLGLQSLATWAVALPIALSGTCASAMGLGPAALASGLGEPLRLTFPVTVQPGEEIGCVQVKAKGDDLPSVFNTRSSVLRSGSTTRVEIRSAQPVNEPAIGIVVSVGCASPISREYVLFLDPPVIPAASADPEMPAAATAPEAPRRFARPTPPRSEAVRPRARTRDSGTGEATTATTPSRPPVARKRRAAPPVALAPSDPTVPVAAPVPPPRPVPVPAPSPVQVQRDRLTVAPSEAGTGATGSTSPSVPPLMNPATPATSGATAPATAAAPTTAAPTTAAPTTAAPTTSPPPTPTAPSVTPLATPPVATPATTTATEAVVDSGDTALREQALRKQQAELEVRIKVMSDQIAALRVQTAALVNRNQVLQDSTFSPMLIWLLIALAVLAILIAGWMAWRYTQLRRSIEGSAWWTGNTANAASASETASGVETRGGLVALDPGTRLSPKPVTQIDTRASVVAVPAASVVSNVTASRTTVRNPRYQAPIDTDFTVSDIEAAMATVRTVSPPRAAPTAPSLEDSDFAPLGGPTLPSPFTQPPPPAPRPTGASDRAGSTASKFVDLDIPPISATPMPPPLSPSTTLPPVQSRVETHSTASSIARESAPEEEMAPLDFKLDIPESYDPLATDSMRATMILDQNDVPDRLDNAGFELPSSPTSVDFELPSSSTVAPLDGRASDLGISRERHGATALGDLFPSLAPGADTILDLDDQEASPLTATEVDRMTTTAVNGDVSDAERASPRYRLARFADLMNQVDELSETDPLRAIALLRQYVLRDEQIPTLLWLRLFELYRKVDKKSVYDALGEHFARRYHRPMIAWDQTLADRVPQTPLSAMTTVDREIETMWGQEGGLEKMRSLLCDRDQDDAIVFNAVLQRDLLDAAKVFPRAPDPNASQTGGPTAA